VKKLSKQYGNHWAVKNLSFTVNAGEVYGFLGPNGAGKSTTMNIMTGCLGATEGQVLINGHDIFEEPQKAKANIGYLPEIPPLYLDMTPYEYLTFVAKLKGVKRDKLKAEVARVMELTGLNEMKNRLCKNLSKGYRQRVGIAQALLNDPPVIILDEPTVGLDPKQIIEIRDLIKSLGREHTVILSSHILSEVRAVCDMIMIISEGNLVAIDTPENLEARFSSDLSLVLTVKGTEEQVAAAIAELPKVESYTYEPQTDGRADVRLKVTDNTDISEEVFVAFANQRCPILNLNRERASLEDIFLELTESDVDVHAALAEEEAAAAAEAPAEETKEEEK